MQIAQVTLTGLVPLLMHSSRLVDDEDEIVIEMKSITNKKTNKTDADRERLKKLEFIGGMWVDESGRPAVPALALEACFRKGAMAARKGAQAQIAVWCDFDSTPLIYDGPKTAEKLYEQRGSYGLRVPIVVQKSRVMRMRPKFPRWSLRFEMCFDEHELDERAFRDAWTASARRGLGDWRPKYGRFEVAVTVDGRSSMADAAKKKAKAA